ncbi:DUF3488 and transglutaminase-like domain-containing protein [Nocardioides sp. R-C-SC26]|uniref:transglutaminase family protein n=1 Tax=Nocardioides sp. R-C-SC26 TaxID=2870414 RepID=UPI001E3426FA|nr:DUF3488 and transglutaminase-like domain-containing protein [Nocardioides sp. R-C-SC26]
MRFPAAISFAAALTAWCATFAWTPLTRESWRYLSSVLALAVVVAVVGALLRWRRAPWIVAALVQLVVGVGALGVAIAGSPVPGPALWEEMRRAGSDAATYLAPVPSGDGVGIHPILIVCGWGVVVLTDLLVGSGRRAPWAGLPILAALSAPVGLTDDAPAWWVFLGVAAGYLLLLFLAEQERLAGWGRTFAGPEEPARLSESVRVTTLGIASGAVALAVVAPLAIPTLDLEVFDVGRGTGSGEEIRLRNPMVDLRRDLSRGEDVPLLRIVTDDPQPHHLRISALTRFNGEEWSSGDRSVPRSNLPDGEMPPLAGVDSSIARTSYRYDVAVTDDFRSRWLPTQAPISGIEAPGDWRFDETTMDFIAGEDDLDTAGMRYVMTGVRFDAEDVRARLTDGSEDSDAGTPAPSAELTQLPPSLDPYVRQLAREVTGSASDDFERAAVLQRWFRSDGGFTYSDEAIDANLQIGTDQLVAFLRDDKEGRIGYCEQFAAAMAVMARSLDIPARVAVGFLAATRIGVNTWEYSAHDLHAWVELYFPGAGWVLFDPTPGGNRGRVPSRLVPSYTRTSTPIGSPSDPAAPSASPAPAPQRPTPAPSASPRPVPSTADSAGSGQDRDSGPAPALLAALLGSALLVVGALTPRGFRRRRRAARLHAGTDAAWEELADTCVDLGHPWPRERSPRETARTISTWLPDGSTPARAALGTLVAEVERARYANAHPADVRAVADAVTVISDELSDSATAGARRRAIWLPRSLLARRRADD